MLPELHLKVLKKVYAALDPLDINWVVTGSTGLALWGIPLVPHDLDLQSDEPGTYGMEKALQQYVKQPVEFSSNGKLASHFGRLEIDGLQVEIMGEMKKLVGGAWEGPVELTRYKRYISYHGMRLPLLDLAYEYEAYLKMGRLEKAALIKSRLEQLQMAADK
jgi:hypothetical protein